MASIPLKSIKFPGLADTYTVPQIDNTLAVTGKAADAKATGDALAEKANVDGEYESMTVGNAEQLISTVFSTDSEPYLYRTAGGSADIGDREYDKIIGGTIVWNQLLANANFSNSPFPSEATIQYDSTTDSVSYSATITTSGYGYVSKSYFNIKKDHIYLLQFNVEATNVTNVWGKVDNAGNTPAGHAYANGTHAFIQKSSRSNTSYVVLGISANSGTSVTATFSKPQIFDLTQMFGTTIANYIYSLEQSTPGAGVAWFRKLFPKPYYEYNPGELISVSGLQSHDMVGFNQWDEEWELGLIAVSTGANIVGMGIRSKNMCRCVPRTMYNANIPYAYTKYIFWYDDSGEYIKETSIPNSGNVTSPSNACYFRIRVDTITTYNHDICINLRWDGERNGEYEPYKLHSYPLDSNLELRGIPKLDANNQLYYDGDIYKSDGTVTQRYGMVDLGTLSWKYSNAFFRANPTGYKKPNSQNAMINAICNGYMQNTWNHIGVSDKEYAFSISISTPEVIFKNTAYSDVAAFKAAMSGVYLVYELATPTTETAEPYQNPQVVDNFGTEEYVTDSIVPVGHETRYAPNLRAKLETAPESPNGDGDYIMRQTGGMNAYAPLVIPKELPANPGADGTYVLKATVTNGETALSWEVQS